MFIGIHHENEGGIEKSVPRITDWHHEACRVMAIGDRDRRIFLPHHHTHDGYFFYLILYLKEVKRLPENPKFAEMRHGDVILTLRINVRPACGVRATVRFLSFSSAGTGCEIKQQKS